MSPNDIFFAGELTFHCADSDHLDIDDLLKKAEELANRQRARGYAISPGPPDADGVPQIRVRSPDGWEILIGVDYGVIEIKTGRHSLPEFEASKEHFKDLWRDLKEMSFKPALFRGGGHISIGLRELLPFPLVLQNFVRDYFRHNELSMGVMSYDTGNSLPLALLPDENLETLRQLIDAIDGAPSLTNIQNYLRTIEDPFIPSHLRFAHPEFEFRDDEFAINFEHVDSKNFPRIELRAVRPQATFDIFLLQIRMLAKRIAWLATLKEKIPLTFAVPMSPVNEEARLTPPISTLKALDAFNGYLTEIGEKFTDHAPYLFPNWQETEIPNFCQRLLKGGGGHE